MKPEENLLENKTIYRTRLISADNEYEEAYLNEIQKVGPNEITTQIIMQSKILSK